MMVPRATRALVASLAVLGPMVGVAGSVAAQTEPSSDLVIEGGDDRLDDYTIEPLDDSVVRQARTEGERVAVAIRSRIKELNNARLTAAASRGDEERQQLAELQDRYLGGAVRLQEQGEALDDAQLDYRRVVDAYLDARAAWRERAVVAHQRDPLDALDALVGQGDALRPAREKVLLSAILEDGRDRTGARYLEVLAREPEGFREAAEQLSEGRRYLEDLTEAQAAARAQLRRYDTELGELAGRLADDVVFPIAGDEYNFIDSFGFCRDGCRRSHQGVDIMAPHGQELLAVERGVLFRIGTGRLGGIKLWLLGESGTAYYYAHLSGYSDVVAEGAFVEAGTVIGYVGDTGNARGTPPHLHFEVRPDGGRAVNPYPLARAAADLREQGRDPLDRLTG